MEGPYVSEAKGLLAKTVKLHPTCVECTQQPNAVPHARNNVSKVEHDKYDLHNRQEQHHTLAADILRGMPKLGGDARPRACGEGRHAVLLALPLHPEKEPGAAGAATTADAAPGKETY